MLSQLGNLSLKVKLWGLVGLMVAIIVGFTATYTATVNDIIAFSDKERVGNDAITEIRPLLGAVAVHRGTQALALAGDVTAERKLRQLEGQVDQILAQLNTDAAPLFETLGLNDTVASLPRQWQAVLSTAGTATEKFDAHSAFVTDVKGVIVKVADASNLTLDPDLDSFYLMDFLVARAPSLNEFTGQLRGLGAQSITRGQVSTENFQRISALSVRFEDALNGAIAAIKSSSDANPAIATALDADLTRLETQGKAFQANVEALLSNERIDLSGAEFFALGTSLIQNASATTEKVAVELEGLLAARVGAMQSELYTVLCGIFIALGLALAAAYFLLNYINKRFAALSHAFEAIRSGDLDRDIQIGTRDEIGGLFTDLKAMQSDLAERTAHDRKQLVENARIRQGLDAVQTATVIADAEGTVIYLNGAAESLMADSEANLRSALPRFAAKDICGQSFEQFQAQPVHRQTLLDSLIDAGQSEIKIGTQTFNLIATAIIQDGERLGTAVEWTDVTAERGIEQEVAEIVAQASAGELSNRLDETGKQGFFKVLANSLNSLLSRSEQVIDETNAVMSAMAKGDLTQSISGDFDGKFGELKASVNQTNVELTRIVGQILNAADQIRESANEIAQGNADLSHRTEEQASSLEETASSMEQMTSLVSQSARSAKDVNELTNEVQKNASEGGQVVQSAIQAMQAIDSSSKRIGDIIGVIDEIAFQTNLLALNAAVEAARAGEQGRGFAVVAGEVRSLAGRSAEAAKEVKDLIRDSLEKVADGTQLVNRSGETLTELVIQITDVAGQMDAISKASAEQSSGITQVNTAVASMDEMTQQNAALVEQSSATSENMTEQARRLVDSMSFFNTGEARAPGTERRAPNSPLRGHPKTFASAPAAPSLAATGTDDDWAEF